MASLVTEPKYKMVFKAPVFKIEIAKKNMRYTVEKFCKKMGGLDKCSDRLFYGLFLLLDIYLNTTKTKVNIKKKSLMRKEEYSQQLYRQMEIQAKVEKEGKPAAGSTNSPRRKVKGDPVAKSPGQGKKESKHVRDERTAIINIRKFMLFYVKMKGIVWKDLELPGDKEPKYKSVKNWILKGGDENMSADDLLEELKTDNKTLHRLYKNVFKTHGDLFGGLRDAINDALNTKQAESQASMAGAATIDTFQHESLPTFTKLAKSWVDLEAYFNEGTANTTLQDVEPARKFEEKTVDLYNAIIRSVDDDFPLEQDVVKEEVKNLKDSINDIFNDVRDNYQITDTKKDKKEFEKKLKKPFEMLQKIQQKLEKQISSPTKTKMKNLFLKGDDYEKLRRNFYDELRMDIQLKPGDKVIYNGTEATISAVIGDLFYTEKGQEPGLKRYKIKDNGGQEMEISVNKLTPVDKKEETKFLYDCFKEPFDDRGKTRMMGCLKRHEKKDSACGCCLGIINTIEKHMTDKKKEKTYSSIEESIIKAFENNVYDTKSDNILLSKEATQIRKINIDEWRRKKVMGELLENMKLSEIAEERKFRSWITSCLMPINEDGSLFKNEYEHVFPVLFLFLFVGGYIHLPSVDNPDFASKFAKRLIASLNEKLYKINVAYNNEYKELVNGEHYKGLGDLEKLEMLKTIEVPFHYEKRKVHRVIESLSIANLYPFNEYNHPLMVWMFNNYYDRALDFIIDTIYLFHESVLLCESDPNQLKSNAIYAKLKEYYAYTEVEKMHGHSQLWSASDQNITRFLIPIEQQIQSIYYYKAVKMNHRAKSIGVYGGDTVSAIYAPKGMDENIGAISESLVNAAKKENVTINAELVSSVTDDTGLTKYKFKLGPENLKIERMDERTIRDFIHQMDVPEEKFKLSADKKLAYHEEKDGEIVEEHYIFSESGNRVILKESNVFELKMEDRTLGKRIISGLEKEGDDILITFDEYPLLPPSTMQPSMDTGKGGKKKKSKGKKKRTKKKRRKKKKTRGKR